MSPVMTEGGTVETPALESITNWLAVPRSTGAVVVWINPKPNWTEAEVSPCRVRDAVRAVVEPTSERKASIARCVICTRLAGFAQGWAILVVFFDGTPRAHISQNL